LSRVVGLAFARREFGQAYLNERELGVARLLLQELCCEFGMQGCCTVAQHLSKKGMWSIASLNWGDVNQL
jgi:hypothetical protein